MAVASVTPARSTACLRAFSSPALTSRKAVKCARTTGRQNALPEVASTVASVVEASQLNEVAALADGRTNVITALFVPVVGWVLFNIFGPAKNQIDNMSSATLAGVGLSLAVLASAGSADAATEVAAIAGDGRGAILAGLFLPVVGWVLFNIAGPTKNQIDNMSQGVIGAAGLSAAALLAAGSADAATEVAAIAGDNRGAILATLFLPVVGWVLFNIAGPTKNQIDKMSQGVIGAAGLSAAGLLAAGSADAATEVAAIAGDNRLGILATLFLPVVGWVLFNIAGPTFRQLEDMQDKE